MATTRPLAQSLGTAFLDAFETGELLLRSDPGPGQDDISPSVRLSVCPPDSEDDGGEKLTDLQRSAEEELVNVHFQFELREVS